jgi:hypothetical protein
MSRSMDRRARRLVAGAVAAVVAWTAAGPVWAAACFRADELDSKRVRLLQTELMVAALTCRHHGLGFDEKYNSFIRKFDKRLGHHITVLRGHFKREYGSGFERQYDRFATDLANQASQRAQGGGAYCAATVELFDGILTKPEKDLEGYAASTHLAAIANVGACRPVAATPQGSQRTAAQPKQN